MYQIHTLLIYGNGVLLGFKNHHVSLVILLMDSKNLNKWYFDNSRLLMWVI